ncbi:oxysterol-binding protein-related protein 10-like isoform X2 [Scophthalmus maximus]|uniref:oxysterol-binding protein-related protein 10-like isoform X2 n=1 Tax=Scophthalmus maximus TaxID=52904 RepID=UPI001FA8C555|nr:oxysterol-binding protein-related protein 10-like isoform X2 [Scophthalmus maximus]
MSTVGQQQDGVTHRSITSSVPARNPSHLGSARFGSARLGSLWISAPVVHRHVQKSEGSEAEAAMNRAARPESPARSPGCGRQERRGGQPRGPDAAQRGVCPGTGDGATGSGPSARRRHHKRHLEGVLKKYTNLLQGWQSRYFVLDPEVGQLQYYLNELSKSKQPPRGSLPLLGATVISSNEFPFMFTVQSAIGDFYKLRALDARQQELWMTQLQLCSRRHSDSSAQAMTQTEGQQNLVNSIESLAPQGGPLSSLDEDLLLLKAASAATLSCLGECLSMLQHNVVQALNQNQNQNQNQNHVPCPSLCHGSAPKERVQSWSQQHCSSGGIQQQAPGGLSSRSQSPTHSSFGRRQGSGHNHVQSQSHADNSTGLSRPSSENQVNDGAQTPLSSTTGPEDPNLPQEVKICNPDAIDPNDETTDTEDEEEEEELGVLDDQRSVIIHLLSQLKLGMDLTRVVLPTFILEKRSLLEMYANFMAHPDMFLSITSGRTAEERIVRFVEYYLTAFHGGRRGAVAKKPYNPILGENFHCSWYVPRDSVRPLRTTNCTGPISAPTAPSNIPRSSQRGTDCGGGGGGGSRATSDCYCVRFVAEQVSHHPPVSGFYCECKEKKICVNTHVWTKSKFLGMSVGVSMVGEGVLYLLEHDEEYVFTLPCAYARSILTVPWVELGGKVTISCAKSGYSAAVTFHTKPFYGGKVHRVTAEVRHDHTGNLVCKAQGEWNGILEFTYSNGENKVIDTSRLPIAKKRIRPLEKQGQYESRHLWQHVTTSLKAGYMDSATEHKHCLEERQRSECKQRASSKTPWKPKYFVNEGEGWVYHNPLWKAH